MTDDNTACETAHGLIQGYIGPDHKVIDMKAFYSALVQALRKTCDDTSLTSMLFALCALAAPWWGRVPSSPVRYAVCTVGFSFSVIERWKNAIGMVQAATLNPLWGGERWR